MFRTVILSSLLAWLLPLSLLAYGTAFDPPFRLDDAANVFHIAGDGRIHRNGQPTRWRPGEQTPRFLVAGEDGVVYEDPQGRLRRRGLSLGYRDYRKGSYCLGPDGEIYWVRQRGGEQIFRNGWGTAVKIQPGSRFDVLPDGTLAWIDVDGKLWLDESPASRNLEPGLFLQDRRGDLYYVARVGPTRWRVVEVDGRTGEERYRTTIPRPDLLKLGSDGLVWYPSTEGKILRDHRDTGFRGQEFRLDSRDRCFHLHQGSLHRDGEDLGIVPQGWFDVGAQGEVVWIGDEELGTIYRDGQELGFQLY